MGGWGGGRRVRKGSGGVGSGRSWERECVWGGGGGKVDARSWRVSGGREGGREGEKGKGVGV